MSSKHNFEELMKERHSARDFLQKEIPEEILKKIVQISLDSPSWCNSQPWNIYVVTGKPLEEIKKEGKTIFPEKNEMYVKLDDWKPKDQPLYRNTFDAFLAEQYGELDEKIEYPDW